MTELEILNYALTRPLGIVVQTSNPVVLKQRFYALQRKHPHLSSMSFLTSRTDPEGEIWIVHAQASKSSAGSEETGSAV